MYISREKGDHYYNFWEGSEGSAGERERERRAAKPREARNEGGGLPLQSRAFSHAHDHLRVSHVLLEGLRKKRDCS